MLEDTQNSSETKNLPKNSTCFEKNEKRQIDAETRRHLGLLWNQKYKKNQSNRKNGRRFKYGGKKGQNLTYGGQFFKF